MKTTLLLILTVLIAASFRPNNNVLIGKWELTYIRAANGGWSSDGKDTVYTNGFFEETIKHGKSVIVEFKEDSSYILKDFRIDSSGTISKGKYVLIANDKMKIWGDTLFYNIIKDTLVLEGVRKEILMRYLCQK